MWRGCRGGSGTRAPETHGMLLEPQDDTPPSGDHSKMVTLSSVDTDR